MQQPSLYTDHQHEVHKIRYHVARGFEVRFATLLGVFDGFLNIG